MNGLLLKKFHTLRLYALGAFLEALVAVMVVFIPTINFATLTTYGLLAGFGAGLYWSNKNYLSLRLTRGTNRLYYNALESSGDMLINMLIPMLAGGIIAYGESSGHYSVSIAYQILMGLSLILVLLAGFIVQSSDIQDVDREALFVKKPSPIWKKVRLYNLLANIVVGAEFVIPSVLVLLLVGHEGVLGLVNSGTAVLSAISLYLIGRLGTSKHVTRIVGTAIAIYFVGTAVLAIFYGPVAVLIYSAASTIGWALRWPASYSVIMEIMDKVKTGKGNYAYVCDNELFFNLGRSIGLAIIVILLAISQEAALRFTPMIIACFVMLSLIPLSKLIRYLHEPIVSVPIVLKPQE